jgi:hypothetical protein
MKSIKSTTTKVLSFSFALLFAAGCASVNDANIDLPEEKQPAIETTTTGGSFWDTRNGDDMDPIIDRPKPTGTVLD